MTYLAYPLSRRRLLHFAAGAAAFSAVPSFVWAQAYPSRPVRVIAPFGPGGAQDVVARILAQKLSEQLGRQFYVENVVGAGGSIGTGRAAQATPDGDTLLITGPNFVVNPSMYAKVPYDPSKDFEPVTLVVTNAVALTVFPSLPVHTVNALVDLIRSSPNKFSYGSAGIGTPSHLVGELFRQILALDLVHVPYNGAGPAIAAAVAGHTPLSFSSVTPVVPQVRDGKLRALALTRRLAALPDVPTMAEAGYPEVAGENWSAVFVPAGTPKEIISSLHREIVKIIAMPEIRDRLATLGLEPVANSPEECGAQLRAELAKWAKVVKFAGIKPD